MLIHEKMCANVPGNLQEMEKLKTLIDELNVQIYNPVGLNIKWPRSVAFLFVSALQRNAIMNSVRLSRAFLHFL